MISEHTFASQSDRFHIRTCATVLWTPASKRVMYVRTKQLLETIKYLIAKAQAEAH